MMRYSLNCKCGERGLRPDADGELVEYKEVKVLEKSYENLEMAHERLKLSLRLIVDDRGKD